MKASPRVLILGAGVIGLTTALSLLKRRAQVTILADRFAPHLTSVVAGALWEWPPAVCGYHHDAVSLARSKEWCTASYEVFTQLSRLECTGVFMRNSVFYFRAPVLSRSTDALKMNELRNHVYGFRHDASLIREYSVNPDFGVADAYAHLAPMIDTDVYMNWLTRRVKEGGAAFITEHLSGPLNESLHKLKDRFGADFVVNCSGLGAKELGDSSVYPLRGALVRLVSDSITPRIDAAHCVSHDESSTSQDIVFIVPRGEDVVVLGGLAEPHQWDTSISLGNYEPILAMLRRCQKFLPVLENARIDENEPVRVGLRPFRRQNVRLEQEPELPLIHCYGHGGAGVTLSWGCAEEVSHMILGGVRDINPKPNRLPTLNPHNSRRLC